MPPTSESAGWENAMLAADEDRLEAAA